MGLASRPCIRVCLSKAMPQSGWKECPESVRKQIEGFVADLRETLAGNLVGVYLHGSLALGCFNPERSDVDILVITERRMDVETKRRIAEILLRRSADPTPIEVSFLPENYVNPWQYPTPYDFHHGEDWREKIQEELSGGRWKKWNDTTRTDPDLAAHIRITLRSGVVLSGKPIAEVFPSVPEEHYIDSLARDFEWGRDRIEEYPLNFVLNACRVLAYLREGRICSKEQGGAWAHTIMKDEFKGLVAHALELYRGNRKDERFDRASMDRFAEYMTEKIRALLHAKTDGNKP